MKVFVSNYWHFALAVVFNLFWPLSVAKAMRGVYLRDEEIGYLRPTKKGGANHDSAPSVDSDFPIR